MRSNLIPHLKTPCTGMQMLDRLDWAAGFAFHGDGVHVGIRCTDASALVHIEACIPPTWCQTDGPAVEHLYSLVLHSDSNPSVPCAHHLFVNADRCGSSPDLRDVLDALESALHFRAATSARERLFVHAGVVGVNGRAVLLPGRTMAGKSRLVAALVRAGGTYYSDEFAVLDSSGRVHPYPKYIALRDAESGRARKFSPRQLNYPTGSSSLPVALIVVTKYKPGARWRPWRLSPGQALLALLENTVLARTQSSLALRTLNAAVRDAVAIRSDRAEAGEAAQKLLQMMATRHPSRPTS